MRCVLPGQIDFYEIGSLSDNANKLFAGNNTASSSLGVKPEGGQT